MIVYSKNVSKFLEDIDIGISSVLNDLMSEKMYRKVGKSEMNSWDLSLGYIADVIRDCDIPVNSTVTLEYNLPMSPKRVDLIISGYNVQKQKVAILFELKQWSGIHLLDDSNYLVETFINGGFQRVVHPAYQVWSYQELLKDFNEYIQQNEVLLKSAVLLHNYELVQNDDLLNEKFNDFVTDVSFFGKNDKLALKNFLETNIKFGDDGAIIQSIDNSKIKPSAKLQDNIKSLLIDNRYFKLVDDQIEVFDRITAAAEKQEKTVVIVTGNPGTGKSVVAINLLGKFINEGKLCQYVSRNTAPRVVYSYQLKQSMKKSSVDNLFKSSGSYTDSEENVFDVLLVDEAHCLTEKSGLFNNYGENQINEIIKSAKLSVFFIDEQQRVHFNDIGTKENIKYFAKRNDAKILNMTLKSQFRCNGSDDYLNFVDYLLQINNEYNGELINYNINVIESPIKVVNIIKELNDGEKARVLAGYCWNWNKKEANNPDYHDIVIDNFEMSWNLGQAQTFAIDDSVNEAGCIHSTQGLEFDYVGVIIGDDLKYEDGNVVADFSRHASTDPSLRGLKKLMKKDPEKANLIATELIKNAYRVLLTRGIKGCFVYCEDNNLQSYFKQKVKKYVKDKTFQKNSLDKNKE